MADEKHSHKNLNLVKNLLGPGMDCWERHSATATDCLSGYVKTMTGHLSGLQETLRGLLRPPSGTKSKLLTAC